MSALTKISLKLLGFMKAKTGGSLKILHNYGCIGMVVQCLRTMLDKLLSTGWFVMTNGTLLFVFFSLYWMRSFLSIPLALSKQWLMLTLFIPSFPDDISVPQAVICSLFIGADAFVSESLVVRNTVGAMFRMTTLWGQVLMCICRFVVYVS